MEKNQVLFENYIFHFSFHHGNGNHFQIDRLHKKKQLIRTKFVLSIINRQKNNLIKT